MFLWKNTENIFPSTGFVLFWALHREDTDRGAGVLLAIARGKTWFCLRTFESNIIIVLAVMHCTAGNCEVNAESGCPRMTQELKELGLHVGHRRVGRLMRQNGLRVVRTRKYKATTNSNRKFNIAPNWLGWDFTADRPNQKWAADITYIWTREGWLYLAVMIDLHSRRVVGWSVSNRLKHDPLVGK